MDPSRPNRIEPNTHTSPTAPANSQPESSLSSSFAGPYLRPSPVADPNLIGKLSTEVANPLFYASYTEVYSRAQEYLNPDSSVFYPFHSHEPPPASANPTTRAFASQSSLYGTDWSGWQSSRQFSQLPGGSNVSQVYRNSTSSARFNTPLPTAEDPAPIEDPTFFQETPSSEHPLSNTDVFTKRRNSDAYTKYNIPIASEEDTFTPDLPLGDSAFTETPADEHPASNVNAFPTPEPITDSLSMFPPIAVGAGIAATEVLFTNESFSNETARARNLSKSQQNLDADSIESLIEMMDLDSQKKLTNVMDIASSRIQKAELTFDLQVFELNGVIRIEPVSVERDKDDILLLINSTNMLLAFQNENSYVRARDAILSGNFSFDPSISQNVLETLALLDDFEKIKIAPEDWGKFIQTARMNYIAALTEKQTTTFMKGPTIENEHKILSTSTREFPQKVDFVPYFRMVNLNSKQSNLEHEVLKALQQYWAEEKDEIREEIKATIIKLLIEIERIKKNEVNNKEQKLKLNIQQGVMRENANTYLGFLLKRDLKISRIRN